MRYPVDVSTGKIWNYTGSRPSVITKAQIDDEPILTELGLTGNEQVGTKIHGGPNRMLCHYLREHYQHRRQMLLEQAELLVAPVFDGNPSTEGPTEDNMYIGDIFQWGGAPTQVTQSCLSCFKLNLHFGISGMASRVQDVDKTGWLCSVIASDQASADVPLTPASYVSDVSVRETIAIAWHMSSDNSQYHHLLSATGLSRN